MTKLKGPISSLNASGTISRCITFLRRHKADIAEKTPIVPDAKTLAQLSWRTMFQLCRDLWHTLSAAEKQDWESSARPLHMTGYAWYLSQCLKPNPGIYLPLLGGTMQGEINMANFHLHGLSAPVHVQDPLRRQDYIDYIQPFLYAHGARVYHNAPQAIPNTTPTILSFNSERYDTDTIHHPVVSNSRLTCKTAGKYIIGASVRLTSIPAGSTYLVELLLNGATIIAATLHKPGAAVGPRLALNCVYALVVTDFIEVRLYHSSGGPENTVVSGNYTPEFWMQRIG